MHRVLACVVILLIVASLATAGPASALSAHDDILKKIEVLPDNTGLLLPPVKTAGEGLDAYETFKANGPGVRDFCNRLAYAPNRKKAYYCGGNHGAPHRFNDAWEYDLATNTWTLLFAPDGGNQQNKESDPAWLKANVILKDGYLQTKNGGPIDSVHTWWGLAYDQTADRMLWMNVIHWRGEGYAKVLGVDEAKALAELKPASNLWMFDPATKKWSRQVGNPPFPKGACQGGMLEYIPTLKKTLWFCNEWNESGLWAYDSKANTWAQLSANGKNFFYAQKPKEFPGAEIVTDYDSKRNRVLIGNNNLLFELDLAKMEFRLLAEDQSVSARDSSSVFAYDAVGDIALLLMQGNGLFAFEFEKKAWSKLTPQGDAFPGGRTAGYYDQARNVFVIYNGGRVWVYRYKRATATQPAK